VDAPGAPQWNSARNGIRALGNAGRALIGIELEASLCPAR